MTHPAASPTRVVTGIRFARLYSSQILCAVLIAGCAGSGATAPDPARQLPAGTATVALVGNFSTTQQDSISSPGVIARMWHQPAVPSNAQHPFMGATGLILTWPGTPGGAAPEPMQFNVTLPVDVSGSVVRSFSFETDTLQNGLTAQRVNNGLVAYVASHGTITVTSATDSTLTGTINAGFDRGPVGARLILSGTFNASRCDLGVNTGHPCTPTQVY